MWRGSVGGSPPLFLRRRPIRRTTIRKRNHQVRQEEEAGIESPLRHFTRRQRCIIRIWGANSCSCVCGLESRQSSACDTAAAAAKNPAFFFGISNLKTRTLFFCVFGESVHNLQPSRNEVSSASALRCVSGAPIPAVQRKGPARTGSQDAVRHRFSAGGSMV